MNVKKIPKNIMDILVVILIPVMVFMVYKFVFDKQDEALLTEEQYLVGGDSQLGSELLVLLKDLRNIKLDSDIFYRSSFQSLEDFSTPIVDEPYGRENPFEPAESTGEDGSDGSYSPPAPNYDVLDDIRAGRI